MPCDRLVLPLRAGLPGGGQVHSGSVGYRPTLAGIDRKTLVHGDETFNPSAPMSQKDAAPLRGAKT